MNDYILNDGLTKCPNCKHYTFRCSLSKFFKGKINDWISIKEPEPIKISKLNNYLKNGWIETNRCSNCKLIMKRV
jgi:hypothetical protein